MTTTSNGNPPRRPRLASADAMTRADQQSLRGHNLCLVFSHIASAEKPPSRADLAEITGLTKATVSSLVGTLIEARLVSELVWRSTGGVGRPAVPLRVSAGTVAALGLEINVDFLGVRAVDLTGNDLDEAFDRLSVRELEPGEAFNKLVIYAYSVVCHLQRRGVRLVGAALALPGITDHPSGPLRLAPNLGWRDVDVRAIMAGCLDTLLDDMARLGGVVDADAAATLRTLLVDTLIVENEANVAARTEIRRHADPSFIYVSGEIGIGAAIVVDGQVFSGLHGWAGEIGHVVVDPHGPTCACGASGCLEMYAGMSALMTAAGHEPEDYVAGLVYDLQAGDATACAAVRQAAEALGIALANCINVVDVSRVILGGSFAPLADYLREPLLAQLTSRVLASRWVGTDLDVRASTAGDYPATTGAALSVLDRAMADPQSALWQS